MNLLAVLLIIGHLLILLGFILLAPTLLAFGSIKWTGSLSVFASSDFGSFLFSVVASLLAGYGLKLLCRKSLEKGELTIREGFATVTLGWIVLCLFAALPFYLSQACPNPIDAYFETMSGFTTTGATVISDIENLPRGLMFWRSLTHWIGGMGIVALSVAILPLLGAGGYHLLRAEVPGPTPDRLTPRIAETAKKLWLVYVVISAAEVLFLLLGGMPIYDSLCHTFGTMATGGFSTKNASMGHYDSAYFDGVITFFMFLAGCNFVLHYHLFFRGDWRTFWKSSEARCFIAIIVLCTVMITAILYTHGHDEAMRVGSDSNHAYHTLGGALRYSAFQVVSIVTTTGYCTANFELWPVSCRYILLFLMFIGGCAGSTGGGMKVFRLMVVGKAAVREVYQLIHPREVVQIKISGHPIAPNVLSPILLFFVIYIGLFVFFTLVMSLLGTDLVTSFSSVAATLGNIGPGLAKVGAYENYAWMSNSQKSVMVLCMLIGRLEIYSVIILLLPGLWKRY